MKNNTLLLPLFLLGRAAAVSDAGEFGWKADPYYSYASFSRTLRQEKPVTQERSETALYINLMKESFRPGAVLFEVFASPLPYAAAHAKKHNTTLYENFDFSGSGNLLQTLTAGEEDPWGASVFIGKIVPFRPRSDKSGYMGVAYSGGLITAGKKHFNNNIIYDDNWTQLEWKIKGLRMMRFSKQTWSFRTGIKLHSNPSISDSLYLSLFRDRIDYAHKGFSFWKNSSFDIFAGFRKKDLKPVKIQVLAGKNFPRSVDKRRYSYSLAGGLLWEGRSKYAPEMRDEDEKPALQFILRPTLKF